MLQNPQNADFSYESGSTYSDIQLLMALIIKIPNLFAVLGVNIVDEFAEFTAHDVTF